MDRREFLRRSAPLIAVGAVTPWFVEEIAHRLFCPKRYWDMGAAAKKADDCLIVLSKSAAMPPGCRMEVLKSREFKREPLRFLEVSFISKPADGQEFLVYKPVG